MTTSKANPTNLFMLLDRSGSMRRMRHTVVRSYNEFLAEQRAAGGDRPFHLVEFNDLYLWFEFNGTPVHDWKDMSPDRYQPCGRTALYDALGQLITNHSHMRDAVVAIITDGIDNASHHFDQASISQLIEETERERGWRFIFLAAGIDARAQARSIGIHAKRAINMGRTPEGYAAGIKAFSTKAAVYAQQHCKADLDFTDKERRDLED